MTGIELAASVIAVIDMSARVSSLCFQYYTNVGNARDDIARLRKQADGLMAIVKHLQPLLDGPNGAKFETSQNLRDALDDCLSQLAELEKKLDPGKARKAMRRIGIRALKWPFKSNEVEIIVKSLGRCMDAISLGLQVDQITSVLNVHQEIVLAKLRTADGAAFDSHADEHNARCHPDTRVDLLRQIAQWADDPNGESIFWLNGMAGTGKSTISRTVAQNFADLGFLGASFFFKRGEGDRGRAAMFFTTIAAQLVQRLPSLAPHVRDAIDADPAVPAKTMKEQYEKLVLQPIGKLANESRDLLTILVVVDALDECDREEDVRAIIGLLSQAKKSPAACLKFFVTSRPELPIRIGFEDVSGKYKDLALHQIPEPIIEHDIFAFLEYQLSRVRDDYNKSVPADRKLPEDWPGQTKVQILVKIATPLFVFAATACRFIEERRYGYGGPEERLAKILEYQAKGQKNDLDATYLPVLDQLLVGVTGSSKDDVVDEFRHVVGSIVILASPLPSAALAHLLGIPKTVVDCRLDLLHSVLSISSNTDAPVRLLHLSFRDFLLDPEKRNATPFWVDEQTAHEKIATRCLQLMSTGGYLRNDICNLQKPGTPRTNVDNQTIDERLPSHVRYACMYWAHHLKESQSTIRDGDQAHNFLRHHFLHWLEVLSLIGRIVESIGIIDDLQNILDPMNSARLSEFLRDANRFILSCRSIVDSSPLQLYSSALVFAPEKCAIRDVFQHYLPSWICQPPKVDARWSAALQTLEGHKRAVYSVAFAGDGMTLASASEDETIKIWNATTGSCLQTLDGHSDSVKSVAFLGDGKLASASFDNTVKIWDVATGSCLQTLEGHTGSVRSVAFSGDGKLASASFDNTVKIWDAATGSCLQTLVDHSSSVDSVAFSGNGTLASASSDNTVKIWDAATGSCLQTLVDHSSLVNLVAFSGNGKLASASNDNTVKIWDVTTGSCLQTLEGHRSYVTSVAFSGDGNQLASASYDKTVKIWDTATGSCQQTLRGHSGPVSSLAFSGHGTLASASFDNTIKIWDAATSPFLQRLEGHSDWVSLVTFSGDGNQLASASRDRTLKIWDTATTSCLQTLEGHSDSIKSVAFSDGGKLASASDDRTIRVWDAATGSCLQTLKNHSNSVKSVAFSGDGKLASASDDRTVKIWNADTGSCLQTLEGHSDSVNSVVFSGNGKQLASASDDRTVKIWDATTGSCLRTLEGHKGSVRSVAFSSDGMQLASASGRIIRVWDAASGSCLQTLRGHNDSVSSLAFSGNGEQLASASDDRTVKIWDATTGLCLQTLEGHKSYVSAVAFSGDGKQLASASNDRTAKIWDATTGSCLQTLKGHSGWVRSVAFSGDGKQLASVSASGDETIKIWDVATGGCCHTINVGPEISSLSFDSTASYLLTNIGRFKVNCNLEYPRGDEDKGNESDQQEWSLSDDGSWVTWHGQNMLWLPPEYRPASSDSLPSPPTVAMGCVSGRVFIIRFSSHMPLG